MEFVVLLARENSKDIW